MRKLLILASLILGGNASAQVINIECPQAYPPKDVPLDVSPPGQKGRGLVPASNPLAGWSLFDGEFGESAQIHAGEETRVKGGTDTVVPPIRWLACHYRGGVAWWAETGADRAAEKGLLKQGCTVQARETPKAFRLICK